MILVVTIMVFIAVLCTIEGIFFTWKFDESKKIREKLKLFSDEQQDAAPADIVRKTTLSTVPWLNGILARINLMQRLDTMLRQANVERPVGVIVLLSLVLALAGFSFCVLATRSYPISFLIAGLLGSAPFLYIWFKRRRRIQKFERQLPGALDLISRSLKAGHAFSTGLHVVVQEFDDPVGTEFHRTERQIRLGASVEQALRALTERVSCPDLRFFAVAVTIQRETGGNLAEILENISTLIKGRFKMKGRVRALSAEGRLSAIVLLALPFAIALLLSIVNPEYVGVLVEDHFGKMLIFFSLLMLGIGIIAINKMIDVKV
ncbi:MAG: type II secretion system F family protein [Syntrophorhabdales bacterium]|jgi:tight adherence protein B